MDALSRLIRQIPSLSILEGYVPTTANDFEKLRGAIYSIPLMVFIIFAPGGVAGLDPPGRRFSANLVAGMEVKGVRLGEHCQADSPAWKARC